MAPPQHTDTQPQAQDKKRPPQSSLDAGNPKRPKPVPMHNKSNKDQRPHASTSQHGKAGLPSRKAQNGGKPSGNGNGNGNGRSGPRPSIRDVRAIAVSRPDPAVQDGQLNVQSFVDARAFELKALTESMRRTKASSTSRAFQIVPITLRRRTAAHNHKRVPKRLQPRAKREMAQDNTPTVNSKTRKPGSTRSRLRAENARRLGLLAKRKKLLKAKKPNLDNKTLSMRAARPKIRRNTLNDPIVTNRKFRRRQINKTWLPTHMWHTKRARMTEPSKPLWRFAIPLTPSNKSYRPTHRAQFDRGALAWDMSYMSTISLTGRFSAVQNILKALGISQDSLWNERGARWRAGAVHWSGLLKKHLNGAVTVLAPATVIWNPADQAPSNEDEPNKQQRKLFIRTHPSVFLETFEEFLRLARMNNPRPYVEDLRYEIGAIELVGPASTEALLKVIKRHPDDHSQSLAGKFEALTGLKDPASLPTGSMFAFSAADPRLRYPFLPRRSDTAKMSTTADQDKLCNLLNTFHKEPAGAPMALFDRDARFKASRLPSQKSLNRRKTKGAPGAPLKAIPEDPPIPVVALASRHPTDSQAPGSWTILLPWKCVLPFWYCLMHCPLSTGGNPQFGGLDELRQLSFERGLPWFPGDVPGTKAGSAWELEKREQRLKKWQRMPKGKRHNFETLNLGAGRKGELGQGWSCAFEQLFQTCAPGASLSPPAADGDGDANMESAEGKEEAARVVLARPSSPLDDITYLPKSLFNNLLQQEPSASLPPRSLVTIRIRMITKGTPLACARIYRLPTSVELSGLAAAKDGPGEDDEAVSKAPVADVPASFPSSESGGSPIVAADLFQQWLSLLPNYTKTKHYLNLKKNTRPQSPSNSKRGPLTVEDRQCLIAQQLTAPLSQSAKSSLITPRAAATAAFFPPHATHPTGTAGGVQASASSAPVSLLLSTGQPICPDQHDLIGFVTKGEYNLRDGRGEAIGSISATLAAEELARYTSACTPSSGTGKHQKGNSGGQGSLGGIAQRLCVVRNAGEDVGRLARWELVGV